MKYRNMFREWKVSCFLLVWNFVLGPKGRRRISVFGTMLVPWRWNKNLLQKCWYFSTDVPGITSPETILWILITARKSSLMGENIDLVKRISPSQNIGKLLLAPSRRDCNIASFSTSVCAWDILRIAERILVNWRWQILQVLYVVTHYGVVKNRSITVHI